MQGKSNKPEPSPADIAREAFRRLAAERIPPTPEAYRKVYDEIAGLPPQDGAEKVLADFAAHLATVSGRTAALSADIANALAQREWESCARALAELVEDHLRKADARAASAEPSAVISPPARHAQSYPLVEVRPDKVPVEKSVDDGDSAILRDLLIRALTVGMTPLLRSAPDLAQEAEDLATALRASQDGIGLNELSARLKQLCFKIEMRSGDLAEEHELLLRLFRLLLENVGELLEDDSWLAGQVESVQTLLSGPINHGALVAATRNLKEIIYKQGVLKHGLAEAKLKVKNMMITFVDRLGQIAETTGDYHQKIGQYSQKIGQAKNITDLSSILDHVLHDTRVVQTEALRSRDQMMEARQEVQDAESRIDELEAKLEQMSELVREDGLTGSLNRRGLEDVFEREFARAERHGSPLCIALLDLDDFKRLNDTHGHSAGDGALVHLVRVIKDTLRTMDVVGRFGGEEFLIVLPDTPLANAIQTVTRVQRELTKRIFMHDNARLLMTFSAGVALRGPGEDKSNLIKRADAALYQAKKAGKNRVVAAD